jgi:hypothetical protein
LDTRILTFFRLMSSFLSYIFVLSGFIFVQFAILQVYITFGALLSRCGMQNISGHSGLRGTDVHYHSYIVSKTLLFFSSSARALYDDFR